MQEAFFSLWRHREGLVVRAAGIAPWLVVVTRNAAIAMSRSEGARAQRETRAQPSAGSIASDPADTVASQVDAHDVRAALEALPAEQRSVIIFAYYDAMTMSQIAERMQTPLGTVKRRAQMALQRLARSLGEQRL